MSPLTLIANTLKINRLWLALGAGALSTLAQPPVFFWPVLFITLPLMVFLLDDLVKEQGEARAGHRIHLLRKAVLMGWMFGFGFFMPTLYWIGSAFLVEAEKFAWALPFAVTLLPAALAVFYAFAFASAALIWNKGPERLVIFAFVLFMADWLRGHCFTGFPWNLFGHSLTGNAALMQSVSLFGIYGLSALACYIFTSPACLLDRSNNNAIKLNRPLCCAPLVLGLFLLASLFGYGQWRLIKAGPTDFVENIELILVQPNIPQQEKVNPALRAKAFERVLKLTQEALKAPRSPATNNRLIIWPETAIPFALNKSEPIRKILANQLGPQDQLITGAYHVQNLIDKSSNDRAYQVYNSLYVINSNGKITGLYDKHHLVPFGEYLPFPGLFNTIGLEALVRLRGGFTAGPLPKAMLLTDAPAFMPYICYEAIFPFKAPAGPSIKWLLNISNDGWFGHTAGPYQHAHLVRLRALEAGLPIIRVVNGGISGVFDSLARPMVTSKLDKTEILTTKLPKAMTYNQSLGYGIFYALFILMVIGILISTIKFFDKTT